MPYTIKKLATISGVSPRALRFYDEIGLLKPAYYGDNQYRYYEEEQLLLLQQILFFRELGFPLTEIQRIISSHDFDKIEALNTHKSILQSSLERTETLIKTVDKTISHLRGNLIMRDVEMYDGFDPNKQQEHEKYMLESGIITQREVDDSWKKVQHWKKDNWEQFKQEGEQINLALAKLMEKNMKPSDLDVQDLIGQHHAWVKHFWTPTKDSYSGLAQMYLDHPDYRSFYNRYYPNLVEYVVEAMRVYAAHKLS